VASAIVDIEFAHMDMAPLDVAIEEEEVMESASYARALIEDLNHAHIKWTTSVLIDDKRARGSPADLESALERVARLVGPVPVHRALMERHLTELKRDFLALFDRRRGSAIESDFHRYQVNRDGELGCSQDIAVWTAVRLGLIPASVVCKRIASTARFGFGREQSPDLLVTILPSRYRSFEERAAKEYLRHLNGGNAVQRCIQYYFAYNGSRSEPPQVGDLIRRIGNRLKAASAKAGDA